LEHIEVENRKMLEKLALEYSLFGSFAVVLVFILLMIGLLLAFLIAISNKWEELEYSNERFKTAIKVVMGVTVLVGVAVLEMMLFFGIKIKFTEISTYYNIHNSPSNVTEYYKIEQKDDLLDLKLKDKYRDLGMLQEQAKAKIVKEDDKAYQVEYQGNQFEVKKEKK
jgi:amino acid transporter